MSDKLTKFLTALPVDWSNFLKVAPLSFKQDYLDKTGMTRDQFLELAETTKLFDHYFFKHDPTDLIYWRVYNELSTCCKGWELNHNEKWLYDQLTDVFTEECFIKLRRSFLPISSQDKMLGGVLFKQYAISSVNGREDLKHLVGRCYQKTVIKPILK